MMKILIDLNSIEENEDAGANVTYEQDTARCTFKGSHIPLEYLKDDRFIFGTYSYHSSNDGNPYISGSGYITGAIDTDLLDEVKGLMDIEITRPVREICHKPIPKYSYSFENVEINCSNCGASNNLEDLVEREITIPKDLYEYTEYDCCPNCYEPQQIKYETIDEALKRNKDDE